MQEKSLTQLQFLAGGGENGELIRNFDWANNPLGPPEGWPKSLKTCVRIILTSRQPMFVWWGADLINIYNDAYQAIVGGKHPGAMGQPAREVWKEIWDEVGPRAHTALSTNEGTYDESLLLIMERNGYPEETYYTFSYSPVPGDDGEPEGIICANTDDTDRIISERQLRTLKDLGKAFIDSQRDEDIYNRTVKILGENPHDFLFTTFYTLTEQELQLAGTTLQPDQVLFPQILPLHNDQEQVWNLQTVVNILKSQVIDSPVANLPSGAWPVPPKQLLLQPIIQSGQAQPFGVMIIGLNPYRLLDDRYAGFFDLIADQIATGISNVRAYEEERKRVAALEEIDKAKTVFFNNVSHEFRTPLTLMLGPLDEMMKKQDKLSPDFLNDLTSVNRNARRLLKLVNSLLEFSRIEAGRVQAAFSEVDLCELTQDLASGFRSIIERAGLTFTVACDQLKQKTYVDPEMWEKIVLNLLSNAFKYTLTGSIDVRLKEETGAAILEVKDTGVGIPAEELPKMFERFHRVPGSEGRTHEGTGIGLSLIQELVKMHGGVISVESAQGKGSCFTVRIPTGKAHLNATQISVSSETIQLTELTGAFVKEAASLLPEEVTPTAGNPAPLAAQEEFNPYIRVLIVDDNADMRAYLSRLLQPYWQLHTAKNGAEALSLIPHIQPDIVISDIMMPVMDGKEMLKAIRKNAEYARIPVILLSARAGEEARIEGLEAGADDYLVKPFSAKELISKIRSQVALTQARSQAEKLLKFLFINAPTAICILRGPELVVEMANTLMLQIWGRTQEDVVNRPLMEGLPELTGQGFDELLHQVMVTGERYISSESQAVIVRNGKPETLFAEFMYEPFVEANGTVSGVIVVAHEITDLVNQRQQARQHAEQLQQQMKQKDEFLSIASHELKTPVTSIKAVIEILARLQPPDSTQADFVQRAGRQVRRLVQLVNDLLDVSSLEAGKLRFDNEQVDLADILKDVVEQHRQISQAHELQLELNGPALIQGDRNRLEQVITNLISNAIKYSPEADKVIIRLTADERSFKVAVQDFGIGIPDEKLARVFERFYRVEETMRNFSGMGLGLYISAQIIDRHGGQIKAERNPNGGTTFWFSLPAGTSD